MQIRFSSLKSFADASVGIDSAPDSDFCCCPACFQEPVSLLAAHWSSCSNRRKMHVKSHMCMFKNGLIKLSFKPFLPGGRYQLEIKIPETYPFNPPKVENESLFLRICFTFFSSPWLSTSQHFLPCVICKGQFFHPNTIIFSGAIYNKDLASQH